MSFRDSFPILYSNNVARAAAFYRDAFGFEQTFRWPPDGETLEYAFLRNGDYGLGIGVHSAAGPEHGRPPDPGAAPQGELCVYVDDVGAAAERLRAVGAREVRAPADMPWRERMAYFADPDGHLIQITAPLAS